MVACTRDAPVPLSKQERFAQYLAGIEYLEAAQRLSVEEKAAYYARLTVITGVSAHEAKAWVARYGDDPRRWGAILESVLAIVNPPTEHKEE